MTAAIMEMEWNGMEWEFCTPIIFLKNQATLLAIWSQEQVRTLQACMLITSKAVLIIMMIAYADYHNDCLCALPSKEASVC